MPAAYIGDNPKVDIGSTIPGPDLQKVRKKYYEYITFDDKNYQIFNEELPSFIPSNQTMYFHRMLLETTQSTFQFVSDDAWETTLRLAPTGFLSATNSIMPKMIVPSRALVDNGIDIDSAGYKAYIFDAPEFEGQTNFNWFISQLAGVTGFISDEEIKKNCEIGDRTYGKKYVCINAKDDSSSDEINEIKLFSTNIPDGNWEPRNLVAGDGAFCLLFNVTPSSSNKNTADQAGKKWTLEFNLNGTLIISINDTGSATIKYANDDAYRAQLVEAKSKEKPPQAEVMKNAYVLVVYPVWNGLVVASGVQDIENNVKISSQYCIYYRDVNLLNAPKTPVGGFSTDEPSVVLVNPFVAPLDDNIDIIGTNCKFQVAYLPVFFSNRMVVDYYFVGAESDDNTTYSYKAYPMWSKNGSNTWELPNTTGENGGIPAELSGIVDPDLPSGSAWYRVQLILNNSTGKTTRTAAEMFGFILETTEEKDIDIRNENGSFDVVVKKESSPAGPIGEWKDFIKSISVTIGLDGSNGQMVIDKYGYAGQSAIPEQSIGAITMDIKCPGFGDFKHLFQGLAMGIADNRSLDGGDWTVLLYGLEKKLQDIVLINVPFFDGYKIVSTDSDSVLGYLCLYGGMNWDWKNIGANERLPSSDNIQSPLIDFKTGTTVYDALNQVMEYTACNYVIHAKPNESYAKVHFYKLDTDGLPFTSALGTNWAPLYPDTKIMTIDRTPDFEDLRNEVLMMGIEQIPVDNRSNPDLPLPTLPKIKMYPQYEDIDPQIPWSKPLVYGVPGYVTEAKLDEIHEQVYKLTRKYELIGRTTIPGNPDVRPYDQWNVDNNEKFIIIGVTHNIDLQGKTYTTDIDFASGKLT